MHSKLQLFHKNWLNFDQKVAILIKLVDITLRMAKYYISILFISNPKIILNIHLDISNCA